MPEKRYFVRDLNCSESVCCYQGGRPDYFDTLVEAQEQLNDSKYNRQAVIIDFGPNFKKNTDGYLVGYREKNYDE